MEVAELVFGQNEGELVTAFMTMLEPYFLVKKKVTFISLDCFLFCAV